MSVEPLRATAFPDCSEAAWHAPSESSAFSANVMPFVVRGCNILGIDSATCPNTRRSAAWTRLAEVIPRVTLESLTSVYGLDDLDRLADEILVGHVKGRVVIDVNA